MAKLPPEQRGLGWTHRRARAAALSRLYDGQPCVRCGGPMYRADARLLDLDHTDDRSGYRGLAHRTCNRRAGQAVGVARRMLRRGRRLQPQMQPEQPTRRSRNW